MFRTMPESYFRNKITLMNVILTMMIVILHANSPERFGEPLQDYYFIYMMSMLCRIATPLFFFISALLFYKNCSFGEIERKFNARIYSLLIPYILWNCFFVACYWILSHVPVISSRMNMGDVLNTPKDIILAVLNSYHTDMWFIKNLMCYTLLAPVLLILFQKEKRTWILGIIIFSLALYLMPEYKSLLRWLPVYLMGAMVGYFWDKNTFGYFFQSKKTRFFTIITVVVFLLIYIISLRTESDILLTYFAPILIWFIIDGLFSDMIASLKIKKWMNCMFFIFCTHHFLLNVLQKLIFIFMPHTYFVIMLTFILSPFIVVGVLLWIARMFSECKLYKIMTGGR